MKSQMSRLWVTQLGTGTGDKNSNFSGTSMLGWSWYHESDGEVQLEYNLIARNDSSRFMIFSQRLY